MARVFLAVGHGLRPNDTFDPGAVGNGWSEQDAGDIIVHEAANLLRDVGVKVKDEAHRDDPNYVGTTHDANVWNADFVVTIHHDWLGAPEGAFGHWISPAGKALADDIQQAVGEAGYPLRSDWHKRRTDLYILKNTEAPCVLYECGRIGQDGLDTEDGLKKMGRAIAQGIARHLDVDLEKGGIMATLDNDDLVSIARVVWGYKGWNDDYPQDAWSVIRTILRQQVNADDLAKALADKLDVDVSSAASASAEDIVSELARRLEG